MELIGTGKRNRGRIYVRMAVGNEEHALWRSDDFGRNFVRLSSEVNWAVESWANPNLLIGMPNYRTSSPSEFVISRDGGRNWHPVQGAALMEPLFRNAEVPNRYRTWGELGDKPVDMDPILQIDTDPTDENTFYVATLKGLYVTRDQGRTFRLLPLGIEYVSGVDSFAVDPLDGRYIYAAVRSWELYRSSDRGCSWTQVVIPQP